MESKLPLETLGRIWDLADQDNDGMLNRQEFIVVSIKRLQYYSILYLYHEDVFINIHTHY